MTGDLIYMKSDTNKKILILTGGTDRFRTKESESDALFEEVLDLTLPSKRKYAEKHGYDFKVLRDFGSDPRGIFDDNHIGPQRLLCVFEMLDQYDVVMWIDGDAVITNDEYSVESIGLEENVIFYGSQVWNGHTMFNLPYFSAGNFMMHKTEGYDKLKEYFYTAAQQIGPTNTEEQHILNLIHKRTDLGPAFKIVGNNIFESIPNQDVYGDWYKFSQPVAHEWKRGNFLVHLGGLPNSGRIDIMHKHYSDYL